MNTLDHREERDAMPVKELFAFLADVSAHPEATNSDALKRLARIVLSEMGTDALALADAIGREPSPEDLLLGLLHGPVAAAEMIAAAQASALTT